MEVILMLSYCFTTRASVNSYFQNAFYPSQAGSIGFLRLYGCFALSGGLMTEFEYQYLNITPSVPEYDYNDIYSRILNRSFILALYLETLERNRPQILPYQSLFLRLPSYYVDIDKTPIGLKLVTYFDMLDYNMGYIKGLLAEIKNFRNINYDVLIFLQRNYPFLLAPSALVLTELQNAFQSSNVNLANDLKNYMILFIVIMVLIKLFDLIQILLLYRIINRLAVIFLRCNEQEAIREIHFIDSFLDYYEKNDDFFYLNFAEKALLKREETVNFEEKKAFFHRQSSNKKPAVKSSISKRKFTANYIQPLKKTKSIFFLFVTMLVGFGFFFLNYYYWTLFNSKIQEVIGLNTSFSLGYGYSVSVLLCNNLYLREFLIQNPSYQVINNSYQQPAGRKTYMLAALKKRIATITDIFDNQMPSGTIQAKKTVTDPNFLLLLDHDVCQSLWNAGKIESDELKICDNLWDGAFKKGIMVATTQYLNQLSEIASLRTATTNASIQTQSISSYIKNPRHQHLFLGEYFLSEALFMFYDYVNQFYNPLLEQERSNTQNTLVISMAFLALFMVLGIAVLAKYMKTYYRLLALSLSLMPYEKVTEDEATIQIIENFTKHIA